MRISPLLLIVAAATFLPPEPKTVTIEELDRILLAVHGESDAAVADQLSSLELSERASSARLTAWKSHLPGPRAAEALVGLADASVFLALPSSEMPATPPPDMKTQGQILSRTIAYVSKTVPKLPNFFATRNTIRYDDAIESLSNQQFASALSPQARRFVARASGDATAVHEPLHTVGRFSAVVTYRDGHEVMDSHTVKSTGSDAPDMGLATGGEFGPILSLVLADAVRSHINWSHWEQAGGGSEAVFRYWVPQPNSHYTVAFPTSIGIQKQSPAYHGEIAVNPADGSILRLTVVSDVKPPNERITADIAVEYAPVLIGGSSYICPVRAVAVSKIPLPGESHVAQVTPDPPRTLINDVAFTQYHVFRAGSVVVSSGAYPPVNEDKPAPETASERQIPAPPEPQVAPPSPANEPASTPTPSASAIEPAQPPASPRPTHTPSTAPAPTPDDAPLTLHAQANLVLLDVVVTDHDKAVHGLDRSRFHVQENGRDQAITSFEEHKASAAGPPTGPFPLPPNTFTNLPAHPQTGVVNVLLLDSLNTPQVDQMNVHRQILEFVGGVRPDTSMAVFTLTSQLRMVQGFTTDISRLTAALESPKGASPLSTVLTSEAGSSEGAAGIGMLRATGSNGMGGAMIARAADVERVQTDDRATMTLQALEQIARYLSGIPGRKNLIWFSASFPIGLGPGDLKFSYRDEVKKAVELLSQARVAVYPVSARGLVAQPSSNSSVGARSNPEDARSPGQFAARNASEQASLTEIADQTGGHAFLDTNGLKDAVGRAIEDGSSFYTIGYIPAGAKPDAQFRSVHVHLDGASYKLSYRPGYYPAGSVRSSDHNSATPNPIAAATLFGAPPATQILFEARVLPVNDSSLQASKLESGFAGDLSSKLKGPLQRYIIDLAVNPANLTFADSAEGKHEAQLEFALVAYDTSGKRINSTDRALRMTLTAAQNADLLNHSLSMRLALDLPGGPQVLRISILDLAVNRVGSLEVPLMVAAK